MPPSGPTAAAAYTGEFRAPIMNSTLVATEPASSINSRPGEILQFLQRYSPVMGDRFIKPGSSNIMAAFV